MIGYSLVRHAARCVQVGAILACLADAQEHSQPPSVVTRVCSGCHAVNGDSQLSYVPRLAGMSASYMESKLTMYRHAPTRARNETLSIFLRHPRPEDKTITSAAANQMVGIAKALSPDDLKVAAQWYAAQPSLSPLHELKSDGEGRALFAEGIPSKNVAACGSCHGSEGQGTELAPRIAGQHERYILGQLAFFRDNGRPSSPMTHIAQSLPESDAEAIAKYLDPR